MATDILYDAVWRVSWEFNLLVSIFGDQAAVDELSRRTEILFGSVRDMLEDSLILRISKLIDPALKGKFENASFASAINSLSLPRSDARREKLTALLSELARDASSIKKHRDKRVAHADRRVSEGDETLPDVFLRDLRTATRRVEELYREISILRGHSFSFDAISNEAERQARMLFKVMRAGNDSLDAEREARAARGPKKPSRSR